MPSNLAAFLAVPHLQQLGFALFSQRSSLEQFSHSDCAAPPASSSAATAAEKIRKHFREAVALPALIRVMLTGVRKFYITPVSI